MAELADVHDTFFSVAFGEPGVAKAFLTRFLPAAVKKLLDPESISVVGDLRRNPLWKRLRPDLVCQARFLADPEERLLVLVEHKSYPDRRVGFQLHAYASQLFARELLPGKGYPPPRILSLVLYQGKEKWPVDPLAGGPWRDLPALTPYDLVLRYVLVDLCRIPDEEILGSSDSGRLEASLLAMKHVRDEFPERSLSGILGPAIRLEDFDEQVETALLPLRYLSAAAPDLSWEKIEVRVRKLLPHLMEEIVSSMTDEWVQKGFEKGSLETRRRDILQVVELRFGEVLPALKKRLAEIQDMEVLSRIHEASVTAESVAALERRLEEGL